LKERRVKKDFLLFSKKIIKDNSDIKEKFTAIEMGENKMNKKIVVRLTF
jgi:hypothetical protein